MSKRSNKRRGGRGMFEIRPGQHKPRNKRNGAIFVALILIFLVVLYVKPTVPGFGKKGQEVTFDVDSGINVRPGSTPIRVQGVDVGQVTSVERSPSGKGARVKMLVEHGKGVIVHRDATVAMRWRTVLGRNLYADLKPGSPSAPKLASSDVIPMSRTETQTELDQAVEPLDATGRKAVKTIVQEFDKGFGSAGGYKETVKELGPAMKSLGPGLRSLRGTEPGDLQKAIEGTSRVAGALASQEAKLGNLINDGSVALGVTAARSSDLRSLLTAAAPALNQTNATFQGLKKTFDTLDPVVQQLRPGARDLDATARDARTVLNAASPLLREAKPTVLALKPAVQDLTKLTTAGNDLMSTANPVLDDAIYPILPYLRTKDVESKHKNYEMIGPTLSALANVVSLGDKLGTIANFEAGAGEGSIPPLSPCNTDLLNGSKDLQDRINCEFATKILVAALQGGNPEDVVLKDSAAPNADSKALFSNNSALSKITQTLKRSLQTKKKGASR